MEMQWVDGWPWDLSWWEKIAAVTEASPLLFQGARRTPTW
jgi:hypothetical protein